MPKTLQKKINPKANKIDLIMKHCEDTALTASMFQDLIDFFKGDFNRTIIAAKYHDIGKTNWSKRMLSVPFRQLTETEVSLIYKHPADGVDILQTRFPNFKECKKGNPSVCDIIYLHHERPDGSGYYRIKDMPIEAVIVSMSDIFNACITSRPYKGAMPINIAINEAVKPFEGYFTKEIAFGIKSRFREIYGTTQGQKFKNAKFSLSEDYARELQIIQEWLLQKYQKE